MVVLDGRTIENANVPVENELSRRVHNQVTCLGNYVGDLDFEFELEAAASNVTLRCNSVDSDLQRTVTRSENPCVSQLVVPTNTVVQRLVVLDDDGKSRKLRRRK